MAKKPKSQPDPGQALIDTDQVFRALAHESRRHILLVLHFRGGEMSAGDIAQRFGCSWPTTSNHLKILIEAGLIDYQKQGRERRYTLNRQRLHAVGAGWFTEFQ